MPDWRENSEEDPESGRSPKQPSDGQHKEKGPQQWRRQVRETIDRQPIADQIQIRKSQGDWNKQDETLEPIPVNSWRKWVRFYALLAVCLVTTAGFLRWIFPRSAPLPVHALWVKSHKVAELPGIPFGEARATQLQSIQPPYVKISFDQDSEKKIEQQLFDPRASHENSGVNEPSVESSNPVTAWYINCYAHWDDQKSELSVYTGQSSSLYDPQSDGTVVLQRVLENLASSVDHSKKEAYAWVILDLQFPPIASDLGYMAPKWKTWIEKVLQKIDSENPELYDHLLITIPADDGQLSWLAPEYSASFFGHHFFKLLDSPPTKDWLSQLLSRPLSPVEFQQELHERVRNDVMDRRFAKQTPVWLPEENLQRFQSLGLVPGKSPDYLHRPIDPGPELDTLVQEWEKLTKQHDRAFHWDPLGHARVVAALLELQEAALYCPQGIERARMRLGKAFKDIYVPQVEFGVSLIEDQQRRQYFGDEQVPPENALDAALWEQKPETAGSGAPQAGESESSSLPVPIDKPQHVWRKLISRATESSQTNDSDLTREKLYQALHWLDPALVEPMNESVNTQPIEIYLLHRLLVDINWLSIVDADQRSKACARALVTFDKLQRLASHPEPEISLAISRKLKSVEEQFLTDFDLLLAGQWTKAGAPEQDATELFQEVEDELNKLDPMIKGWADAVNASRESLYLTPHLLGWLLKEYLITEAQPGIEKLIGQLGDAFRRGYMIRQDLTDLTKKRRDLHSSELNDFWRELHKTGQELVNLNSELNKAFQDYVQQKTGLNPTASARTSPQTFRRNLIALQTSLLKSDDRKVLHQQVRDFLSNNSKTLEGKDDSDSKLPTLESRDMQKALDIFVSSLGDSSYVSYYASRWRYLAQADTRHQLFQRPSQSAASASDLSVTSDSKNLATSVLDDPGLRTWAAVLGDAPSIISNTKQMDLLRPANSVWKESELYRSLWQVKRITDAGWGHGEIPISSADSDLRWQQFYFGRLSEPYLKFLKVPDERQGRVADPRKNDIEVYKYMNRKVDQLTSIQVIIGNQGQTRGPEENLKAPVEVHSNAPQNATQNATASVYLGGPGWRLPWSEFDGVPNDSPLVIPLFDKDVSTSREAKRQDIEIAADRWSNGIPLATLAFRGNYRTQQLNWPATNDSSIVVRFDRPPVEDAIVEIKSDEKPPEISFALLVDCSESMKEQVELRQEGQQAETSYQKILDIVQRDLKAVLAELHRLHQDSSAEIRVCVIPFGVRSHSLLKSELQEILQKERLSPSLQSTNSDRSIGHFYSTEFSVLDRNWKEDLEDLIDNLQPQKDTPLYAAIVEATEQLIKRESGKKPFIYVFSDGVNQPEKPEIGMKNPYDCSYNDVLDSIARLNVQLRIFHYDFFQQFDEEYQKDFKKQHSTGVSELQAMAKRSNGKISYDKPDNPAMLAEKTVESLPRPKYGLKSILASGSDQPKNCHLLPTIESKRVEFKVPLACIAEQYQLFQVSATSASGKEAKKEIRLSGGERIQLTFESKSSPKLVFPGFTADNDSDWLPLNYAERGSNRRDSFPNDLWLYNDRINPLSYKCSMRNRDREQFTKSPSFAVGLIEPHDGPASQAIPLADFCLESWKHYPEIRFGRVPWDRKKFSKARLSLWLASAPIDPSAVGEAGGVTWQAKSDETKSLAVGNTNVKVKRESGQLELIVVYSEIPDRSERLIVVCSQARIAERKYQERREEHRFTLPTDFSSGESVLLHLLPVAALDRLVDSQALTRFDMEDAPID